MAFDFGNNDGKRFPVEDLGTSEKPFPEIGGGGFSNGPSVTNNQFSSNDTYPEKMENNPVTNFGSYNSDHTNKVGFPSDNTTNAFNGFNRSNSSSNRKNKIKQPKPPRPPINIPWRAVITISIIIIVVFALLFYWDVIEAILANLLAKIIVIAIFIYIFKLLLFGGHRR